MADPRFGQTPSPLAHGDFTLQPRRSRVLVMALWTGVALVAAALGATGMHRYLSSGDGTVACHPEPPPEGGIEAELTRTRLALDQERSARATVQKTADASAAEAQRLAGELRFLRGQSGGRAAPAHPE